MASRGRKRRVDVVRGLARVVAVLLGLLGAMPVLLGIAVRTNYARAYAARTAEALLAKHLDVAATFEAEIALVPPAVVVRDLRVPATDGGGPAISVDRVRVVPRLFALLGGKLDVGDVEIERPRVRLTFAGGQLANVRYRLPPKTKPDAAPSRTPPVRALSITEARVAVLLADEGVAFLVDDVDVDVAATTGPVIDAALTVGAATVRRRRAVPGGYAIDEDAVCGLSARVHADEEAVVVRRLDLAARLDSDPREGAPPSCVGPASPSDRLDLSVSRLRLSRGAGPLPVVSGKLGVHVPLRALARILPASAPVLGGDVTLDADVAYTGRAELPTATGRIVANEVALNFPDAVRRIAHTLEGRFETTPEEARLVEAKVAYGGGQVTLHHARIAPLTPGIPVEVDLVEVRGVRFPLLLADIGVTPNTIVEWTFDQGTIRGYRGYIDDPERKGPSMMGDIQVATSNFEVTDRAWNDPARRHVVAVKHANVRGKFGVEPNGVVFRSLAADFGQSHADVPSVLIGFREALEIRIGPGTRVDLGEISPIATLKLGGKIEVDGQVHGGQSHPRIDGEVKGTGFRLGDLPLADVMSAHAEFAPYILDFTKLHAQKGKSAYESPLVRIDLQRPEGIAVDAQIGGKGLDARDLLTMLQFENDPRLTEVHGTGDVRASVHFENGGARDRCRSGVMDVRVVAELGPMALYGERYDGGSVDLDYLWFDRLAQERGVDATIRAFSLKKGRGTISGAGAMRQGGVLSGHFVAHEVPLSRIDALGDLGRAVDGSISASGELSGTVEEIAADLSVTMSPVRVGQKQLPASAFAVRLVPTPAERPAVQPRLTPCGIPMPAPFDRARFDRDLPAGIFHTSGSLFGGQLVLDDVGTTRQSKKLVTGRVIAKKLDLGAIGQLVPAFVLSDAPPTGELSGTMELAHYELDNPERARVTMTLDELFVARGSTRARLRKPKDGVVRLAFDKDEMRATPLSLDVTGASGITGALSLSGTVKNLTTTRELDLDARLAPIDLSSFTALVPRLESAAGKLEATLTVRGRAEAPALRGEIRLVGGEVALRGAPVALEGIDLLARIEENEVRIVTATARAGGGRVTLSGRAPLRGYEVGEITGRLEATEVRLPLTNGVDMSVNAQLTASSPPPPVEGMRRKVAVTGGVTLASFLYTRPITFSANIDRFARQGKRTDVTVYDPDEDVVDFSITVRPLVPLSFRNNLIEADVVLDSDALVLSGTNQRFGMRGALRVVKGGTIRLRANEFDIRSGTIRFEDPTRIAPRVDLLATTDYRRYTSSTSGAAPTGGGAAAGGGATGGRAGGSWRITLHAHGDADDLKLDLSSEPTLSQDDIVLLLAVGMTRAELDQLQAANLGSTAALEALSALSGADTAVKTAIPIIDDFRFGSAYSTRTGRTEPTVTVGKRISDRLRANVITGLSENRDVRSNVEWRLSPQTSVLGNYDNLNDVTSQGLGNLGADFRVRLEF